MKLCKDCKYFYQGFTLSYCKNPKNGIEPVHGEVKPTFASVARGEGIGNTFSCGPAAKWFEQKPEPTVEVKKRRSLLDWFKGATK